MSSKSQVWFTDFVLAISLFIILLIIYFTYTSNLSKQDTRVLNDLITNLKSISSSLILEGYPDNWNNANVQRLGLTNNNQRIEENKLGKFLNLSYNTRKTLFNTQYDYFVFFKNNNGCLINISGNFGIGHEDVELEETVNPACNGFSEGSIDLSDINPKIIVRTDRLLIYNSEIVDMVIYLWQK